MMRGVHCSWVEMMKIHAALSNGKRGDQAALEQFRCVDQSTVSVWKAAAQVIDAVRGKHDLSHVSNFQPTHAREIARAFRKKHKKNWTPEVQEEIADWVDRCETENLTVQQLHKALVSEVITPRQVNGDETCTVADLVHLATLGRKFGCVLADPPWQYENQGTRAATDNHYDTMTVPEIAALPVADLAADKALLWLWTTNGFLRESFSVIDAWGFEFKSSYVWVKPQIGIGNYIRNAHEWLLICARGGQTSLATDVCSWGKFDRTQHSSKPEPIRKEVIEPSSPGPRLELFGRRCINGWTVWGNQIERGMFDTDVPELA